MNEQNKILYWCLFVGICGVHLCSGFSSNVIKEYQNKDYLVSSLGSVNKFEDNEIRGEST